MNFVAGAVYEIEDHEHTCRACGERFACQMGHAPREYGVCDFCAQDSYCRCGAGAPCMDCAE